MGLEFNDIKVPEELDKVVEQSMELLRLESKRIQKFGYMTLLLKTFSKG